VGKEYEVCGKGEGGEGSSNGYSGAGGGGMRVGGVRRGQRRVRARREREGVVGLGFVEYIFGIGFTTGSSHKLAVKIISPVVKCITDGFIN